MYSSIPTNDYDCSAGSHLWVEEVTLRTKMLNLTQVRQTRRYRVVCEKCGTVAITGELPLKKERGS